MLALGDIDGARSVRIQQDYLAAFLDHTTRGAPVGVLDPRSQRYPEVRAAPLCASRS